MSTLAVITHPTSDAPAPARAKIEIISPLRFPQDADCVCRTAKNGIHAICEFCREPIYQHCHLPNIAYGFFHPACCPCASFIPTEEELRVITHRGRGRGADVEEDDAPRVVVAKPAAPPVARSYSGLDGRVWVLNPKRHFNSGSIRARIWSMVEDGISAADLYARCADAGLTGEQVRAALNRMGRTLAV